MRIRLVLCHTAQGRGQWTLLFNATLWGAGGSGDPFCSLLRRRGDVDRQPIRFVAHTTLWHAYRLVWRLVYLFPCGCLAPCRGRGRGAGVNLHLRPGERPRDTIVDCLVRWSFLQMLHLCVAGPV